MLVSRKDKKNRVEQITLYIQVKTASVVEAI